MKRLFQFATIGSVLLLLSACERTSFKWSEDVQLSDGSVVKVLRETDYGDVRHELGGPVSARVARSTLAIVEAGTVSQQWSYPMELLILDREPGTRRWMLLADARNDCGAAYSFEAVAPTYLAFRLENGGWVYAGLPPAWIGAKTNLLIGVPEQAGVDHVTVDLKQTWNFGRLNGSRRGVEPDDVGTCAREHPDKK